MARARSRRPTRAQAHAVPAVAASRSSPRQPLGHLAAAPGSRAIPRATTTSQAAGSPAGQASNPASAGETTATSAQPIPSNVAGATAGAASRFAATAYGVS